MRPNFVPLTGDAAFDVQARTIFTCRAWDTGTGEIRLTLFCNDDGLVRPFRRLVFTTPMTSSDWHEFEYCFVPDIRDCVATLYGDPMDLPMDT